MFHVSRLFKRTLKERLNQVQEERENRKAENHAQLLMHIFIFSRSHLHKELRS